MNERIKKLRREMLSNPLSQKEFAERIGLSENFVWMIEKGQRAPSERTINDICREFGVDRMWLETGAGEPFTPESKDELISTILSAAIEGSTARDRLIRAFALLPEELFDTAERILIEISENLKNEK